MKLVEKAYQIEPDDPAITDSVGWGYYRLGKLDKSAEFCGVPLQPTRTRKLPLIWARYCGRKEIKKSQKDFTGINKSQSGKRCFEDCSQEIYSLKRLNLFRPQPIDEGSRAFRGGRMSNNMGNKE